MGGLEELKEQPVNRVIILLCIILFIASGVAQPLLSSEISYSGLGSKEAQLYMLPYYAGMACVGFLYCCIPSKRWCQYKVIKSCGISLIDVVGQTLNYTGNNMAGSGIFAVIYASVSIWCGVFSQMAGLRKLSWLQWSTIFWVFGGLVVSAVHSADSGHQVFIGAMLVVAGSILHALMYVLSEFVSVRGGDEKIPPHINCSTMAIVSTTLFALWQLIWTVPHWEDEIAEPVSQAGTTTGKVILLFAATAFTNFVHSATFFYLLKWLGAVSAAVMKGLQAVLVFVLADPIFCQYHKTQCFDTYKWISLAIVISGVFAYAVVTQKVQTVRDAPVVAVATDSLVEATASDSLVSGERRAQPSV